MPYMIDPLEYNTTPARRGGTRRKARKGKSHKVRRRPLGKTGCQTVCHTNCRSKRTGRFTVCRGSARGTKYCAKLRRQPTRKFFVHGC